eukprot:COSAG02_NODE_19758_length_865_cov_7.148825_1_plen_52_part_10
MHRFERRMSDIALARARGGRATGLSTGATGLSTGATGLSTGATGLSTGATGL